MTEYEFQLEREVEELRHDIRRANLRIGQLERDVQDAEDNNSHLRRQIDYEQSQKLQFELENNSLRCSLEDAYRQTPQGYE